MAASQSMAPMHGFDMDDSSMLEQISEWERHMEESGRHNEKDFEDAA